MSVMCRTTCPSSSKSGNGNSRGALLFLLLATCISCALCQRSLPRHPCDRACVQGAYPMTCRYNFRVESYHSLSKACYDCPRNVSDCLRPHCVPAGGVRRSVVVVNRQLPGPPIHVCLGDRIIVDVHNDMPDQSTSIHWHGILQKSSPYMDGVPQVTQCPISPQSAFRYNFTADKAGTHMWHSHTGCQRADGAVGVLTVRIPPSVDPHQALYDMDLREHSVLLMDWTLRSANDKFAHHFHAGGDNKADTILINGKGRFGRSLSPEGSTESLLDIPMPLEEFSVLQGQRYRFRLMNAGYLNCPIELTVDNHTLLIISSDGGDLRPVRADVLVSYAGERWDFIIEANQPVGAYRIRARGILDCAPKQAYQEAILRYEGAESSELPPDDRPPYEWVRGGLHVNPLNRAAGGDHHLTAAELHLVREASLNLPKDPALKPVPDMQFFVAYDFFDVNNPLFNIAGLYGIKEVMQPQQRTFTPQLNHISNQFPSFPLLPQRKEIGPNAFCNESSLAADGRNCEEEFCTCTHVINVPLGRIVEIILVDKGIRYDANHPFHLHGHAFRVVGIDRLGQSVEVDTIKQLDRSGLLKRNLIDPPVKDTVSVPDGGYAAIRVHFDNPGYWFFHCHIDFHAELGMGLIFKVGEHEQMPPVPIGFPKCGSWFGEESDDENAGEIHPSPAFNQSNKENIEETTNNTNKPKLEIQHNDQINNSSPVTTEISIDNKSETPHSSSDKQISGSLDSRNNTDKTSRSSSGNNNSKDKTRGNSNDTSNKREEIVKDSNNKKEETGGNINTNEKTLRNSNDTNNKREETIKDSNKNEEETIGKNSNNAPVESDFSKITISPQTDMATVTENSSISFTPTDEVSQTFKPNDNATTQTELPINPKNFYHLYAVTELKLKKENAHNEVNKELISTVELDSARNTKDDTRDRSSIMKVPPRFRMAVKSAQEKRTGQDLALREPALVHSEGSSQAQLLRNKAVSISTSCVFLGSLVMILYFDCIL